MSTTTDRPRPTLPTALPSADAAQKEAYQDCTPCRLMGAAAFTGLGAYTWYSGRKNLAEREAEILRSGSKLGVTGRKGMLLVMSLGLVGTGVWRLYE